MKSRWSQDLYIQAFMFAAEVHKDQKVPGSDLPYVVHLALVSMEVMVALSVEDGLNGDLAVQCAALHDVMEDPKVPYEIVEAKFTSAVADGVLALTKDDEVGLDIDNAWERKKIRMADSLNRIKQQPKDKEICMVKMADRITNLQPPPSDWTDKKMAYYKQEAILIYNELRDASPFLAERLKTKIEGYNEKKDPESNRTFSTDFEKSYLELTDKQSSITYRPAECKIHLPGDAFNIRICPHCGKEIGVG